MNRISVFSVLAIVALAVGCETAEQSPAVATQPVAFNLEGAPTVEFSVPDMMCPEGCGEETRKILAGHQGVKDVKINFPAKVAIVAIDENAFNAEKALADLVDHGFDNSTLKASSAQ